MGPDARKLLRPHSADASLHGFAADRLREDVGASGLYHFLRSEPDRSCCHRATVLAVLSFLS